VAALITGSLKLLNMPVGRASEGGGYWKQPNEGIAIITTARRYAVVEKVLQIQAMDAAS
jgi:hypothetical protein